LDLVNKNTNVDAWCKFLEYQVEQISQLYVLQVDVNDVQRMHIFKPTEKQFYNTVKSLFDGAFLIHCFHDSEFLYGHLRATPLVDPTIIGSASFSSSIENPFMEGVDMKQDTRNLITLADAESNTTPDDTSVALSTNTSVRWQGMFQGEEYEEIPIKTRDPYFSEQDMIHWRYKTQSFLENAKLIKGTEICSFDDCVEENQKLLGIQNKDGKDQGTKEKCLQSLHILTKKAYDEQCKIRWPKLTWEGKSKSKIPVRSIEEITVKMS
jgi:hypothetical protein